jgi:hypothetical protein
VLLSSYGDRHRSAQARWLAAPEGSQCGPWDHLAVSSRRAVLATAGLLTLAGCLPADDESDRRPDPDLRLRRRVAREVRGLVAAYAAVTDAFPATTARLGPLAAEHAAHVAALDGPPSAASSPSAAPSPPSPTPAPPATAEAAVAWLAGLERAAARRRARQCRDAGPDLARLLASVGACEAVHAALLGSRS